MRYDDSTRLAALKKSLPSLNKFSRIDYLNQISIEHENFVLMDGSPDNADSALLYASSAYDEASRIGYNAGRIYSLLLLAKGEMLKDSDQAAVKYLSDPLLQDAKVNDDTLSGEKYFIQGELALKKGIDKEAERNYLVASQFFSKAGAGKKQAMVFKSLCAVYLHYGDYEKSFNYCYKTYQAFQSTTTGYEQVAYVWSLVTMSMFYMSAADYNTALSYLIKAKSYAQTHDAYLFESLNYRISGTYSAMGRYDSAEYYLQKEQPDSNPFHRFQRGELFLAENDFTRAIGLLTTSLYTLKKYNNEESWVDAYMGIGRAYLSVGNFALAKNFATEGFHLANKHNDRSAVMGGCDLLSDIYSRSGLYDSAYFFLKKYISLKDSILSKQFFLKLNYSKIISDNEKNELQLSLLRKDDSLKAQQLKQKTFLAKILILSLFIVILVGSIVLRIISLRRKNEKLAQAKKHAEFQQKTVELEMQALRAQMNPHFIFNCLNSINLFIFKNENEVASKYLTRFSKLIRMVLIHSQKQVINLEDELEMLRLYLDMERLRFKDSFHYNLFLPSREEMGAVYVPPLIMQPFCENAIWHGLLLKQGHRQLDISVFLEGGSLNCIIADNGIGRIRSAALKVQSIENHNSKGLKITRERLELFNNGQIKNDFYEIEDLLNDDKSPAGTRVKIKIAYDHMPSV